MAILGFAFGAAPDALAADDATAPQLESFALSPSSVDTSAASRTITVTARITDAGAGLDSYNSSVGFASPSGQNAYAHLGATQRISGTAQDGTYQSEMTIPRQSEQGTWTVSNLYLTDSVGNTLSLYTQEFEDTGYPNTFAQTGAGDATAPQLESFALSPSSVDTSAASRTITVTARITDAGTGLDSYNSSVGFASPSGQNAYAHLGATQRISGTAQDGTYQSEMTIPRQSEQGTWTVSNLYLTDSVGNTLSLYTQEFEDTGYPNTFAQTGAGDATAPQLESFALSPSSVDTSAASRTITVTARITDAGTGLDSYNSSVGFASPSGQNAYAHLGATQRISGTAQDGTYQSEMTIPRQSEQGTWTVSNLYLTDSVGNTLSLYTQEFEDTGYPNTFENTPETTAPQTTIDSGPSGTVNQNTANFGFSSNEAGSSFECKLDSGVFAACTSPEALAGLSAGSHTFSVRATDAADNTDATPATRTWTVDSSVPPDTTAPQTTIDNGPSGTVNQTTANFGFSSNEPGSSYECNLDGGTFAACSSPATRTNLADGDHTFKVLATDAADNTDPTTATRTWTVDTADPQTTIDSGPSGTVNQTAATFTFSSGDAGSSFECKLDGGAYTPCSSPETRTNLADGDHTFKVIATDAADNTDLTAATRTWTVDTAVTTAPPVRPATPLSPATALPANPLDLSGPAIAACSAKTIRPTNRGVVTFRCGSFDEPVSGTLVLRTATKVRYKGKRRVIALGSKRFAAPVGQQAVIRIKLSRQGRQVLRKLRKLRVRATFTARDTANNATVKTSTITLKH